MLQRAQAFGKRLRDRTRPVHGPHRGSPKVGGDRARLEHDEAALDLLEELDVLRPSEELAEPIDEPAQVATSPAIEERLPVLVAVSVQEPAGPVEEMANADDPPADDRIGAGARRDRRTCGRSGPTPARRRSRRRRSASRASAGSARRPAGTSSRPSSAATRAPDPTTPRTAATRSSALTTSRIVSNRPAIDCSAESSATDEDRAISGPSPRRLRTAAANWAASAVMRSTSARVVTTSPGAVGEPGGAHPGQRRRLGARRSRRPSPGRARAPPALRTTPRRWLSNRPVCHRRQTGAS